MRLKNSRFETPLTSRTKSFIIIVTPFINTIVTPFIYILITHIIITLINQLIFTHIIIINLFTINHITLNNIVTPFIYTIITPFDTSCIIQITITAFKRQSTFSREALIDFVGPRELPTGDRTSAPLLLKLDARLGENSVDRVQRVAATVKVDEVGEDGGAVLAVGGGVFCALRHVVEVVEDFEKKFVIDFFDA